MGRMPGQERLPVLPLLVVSQAVTTTDRAAAVAGIRALGIRGCGVSMPY
jgi:shikimate dehydrogenase